MASQSSRSIELLNTRQEGTGTFPQFPKLPPELRSLIWEQSLCQERLVQVDLLPGRSPLFISKNETKSYKLPEYQAMLEARALLVLSGNFYIALRNRQEISKLFRVCAESRQAAQRFYRVQLPCYYQQRGGPATMGTFYFHPELDTLSIGGPSHLPTFAHLLWEHDPWRVGLVNLALPQGHFQTDFDKLLDTKDEAIVRQFLSRLRRVYFGYIGPLRRSIQCIPEKWCEGFSTSTALRSRPFLASVSKFQRLQQDPRPVETDLREVFMGSGDPRQQIYNWFGVLHRWKIEYPCHTVEYRFMVATTRITSCVSTREEALRRARNSERYWAKQRRRCKEDDIALQDPQPVFPAAFGFWLFPITAFGSIPEGTVAPGDWRRYRILDLSGCKPELCLQSLH
jgi:hypothetical protein